MGLYKVVFKKCPQCGGRLKQGMPRIGPEKVVCGHCHAEISTGLKPWSSFTTEQKLWKGFWELIAPSYFGSYFSVAGLIALVVNAVLVLLPLIAILELALSAGSIDASAIGLAVGMFIVGALYVYYLPLKHLRTEIEISERSDPNNLAVWHVGETRDYLQIVWYGTIAAIVFVAIIAVAAALLGGLG
ncbi:MAG: zinc ribbon domain-containing protein [Candidatus Bathyarchaeia archaeon]